ncbi:MAG: sulfotransferase [Syntrophotaleaceae bacterium]
MALPQRQENFARLIDVYESPRHDNVGTSSPLLQDFHRPFLAVLDALAIEKGKSIWVEKTPLHLHFIEEIEARIHDAKFIHIVRNGLDAISSLYVITNLDPKNWFKFNQKGGEDLILKNVFYAGKKTWRSPDSSAGNQIIV